MNQNKAKIFAAIWTPTDSEGNLLKESLLEHLEFLKAKGVQGLVVGGTTGEFFSLDNRIRKELVSLLAKHSGHLKLILNISHPTPQGVEELISHANGFDLEGVILLPSMFYPLSNADMVEYYVHMAKKTKHPFYLYNFPERAGVRLELDVIAKVAEKVPIAGLKQSGSDFGYLISLIEMGKNKGFIVYSGMDTLTPEALLVGAHGCMGGLVNAVPELFIKAINAHEKGESLAHYSSQFKKLKKMVDQKLLFPLNVAALMKARGFNPGAPKRPLSKETEQQYAATLLELRNYLESLF